MVEQKNSEDELSKNDDAENVVTHAVDAEAGLAEDGGVLGGVPDEVGHRVLLVGAVQDEGHESEAGDGEAHNEGPPQDRHH